ncbi:hypothetical protein ACFW04_000214 [Cataglyphis niger]
MKNVFTSNSKYLQVIQFVKISSVCTRFKELNSNIITSSCICYSLHLCSSKATTKLPKSVEEFNSFTLYFTNAVFEEDKLHVTDAILNNLNNPVFKIYFIFLSSTGCPRPSVHSFFFFKN